MARKSLLAILIGAGAVAAPSAFADQGGIPHAGSSGQGRPADQQQQTTAAAQGKALAKGHAKAHPKATAKSHGHGKALAKGHAKTPTAAPAAPAANTHAKAGKTTICHATGSATNPFVTITISDNALAAHRRHQGGRDIIPAPAGGCPATAAAASQQQQSTPLTPSRQQAAPAPAQAQGQVLGESTSGSTTPNKVSVLGASTSGKAPSASSSPAATATKPSSSSGLPFTGTDAVIVAILGLAALLLGVTARRATTNRV